MKTSFRTRLVLIVAVAGAWLGVALPGSAQVMVPPPGDHLVIHGPTIVYVSPPPFGAKSVPPYQYRGNQGSGTGYTYSVQDGTGDATIDQQTGILTPRAVGAVTVTVRDSAGGMALMYATIKDPWVDWEKYYFNGRTDVDPDDEAAGSGLTYRQKYQLGLDPLVASTVADALTDGWKVKYGFDPRDPAVQSADPDHDGLTNLDEYLAGTDPTDQDTDKDGIVDGDDLHPLIQDPTTPPNLRVVVPSLELQQPYPDYSKVDYTSINLLWGASNFNPTDYLVQRRADNGQWSDLKTTSTLSYADTGLLVNRHYEYRVTAIKQQGDTRLESPDAVVGYDVKQDIIVLSKSSTATRYKVGFQTFVRTYPPDYYLVESQTSSWHDNDAEETDTTTESYTQTVSSIPYSVVSVGSYNYDGEYNDDSFSSTNTYSKTYSSSTVKRSKHNLVASNDALEHYTTYYSDSTGAESNLTPEDAYLNTKDTYKATSGQAVWLGHDFQLSTGTFTASGKSHYAAIDLTEDSELGGDGKWVGTRTYTDITGKASTSPFLASAWDGSMSSPSCSTLFGDSTTTTDTTAVYHKSSTPDNPFYSDEFQSTIALSEKYKSSTLIADAISEMPDYPDQWSSSVFLNGTDAGSNAIASKSLAADETKYNIAKSTYKVRVIASAPKTLAWYEIYVPYASTEPPDDYTELRKFVILNQRSLVLTTGVNESASYEINPASDGRADGYYSLIFEPVHMTIADVGDGGKDVPGQVATLGKVVLVNDGDVDGDGIPDWADGYNLNASAQDGDAYDDDADDDCWGNLFTRVDVSFAYTDTIHAKIRFTCDGSDPSKVVQTKDAYGNPHFSLPDQGKLRIWLKDAGHRDGRIVKDGGDYVVPGVDYSCQDLGINRGIDGIGDGMLTIYVEAVRASTGAADLPVKIEVDPTGSMGYVWDDEVRFTALKIDPLSINQVGSSAPSSGVLVKKGTPLQIALTGTWFGQEKEYGDALKWKTRQLNGDGTFTPWRIIGEKSTGLVYTPAKGGCYQIEAALNSDPTDPPLYYTRQYLYVRFSDTPVAYVTDSGGTTTDFCSKGRPDYVGVVDDDWQLATRNNALADLGTTKYAVEVFLAAHAARIAVAAKLDKCNVFVYDKAADAGLKIPMHFSLDPRHFGHYPPSAYEWWNPTTKLQNWLRLPDGFQPQPGYITAGPHFHDNGDPPGGHAGILDYDGSWINAGSKTVNKFPNRIFCDEDPYAKQGFRKYTP